jgi:hypothetical protein
VALENDDNTRGPAGPGSCSGCGAGFSGDQRYCLVCGARRGPLPPAIAGPLASLLRRDRDEEPAGVDAAEEPAPSSGFMPTPRVAAVAVMGMLLFGVFLGSATSQLAQSAGLSSILLEVASSPPSPEQAPAETASAPATPVGPAAPPSATTSSLPSFPAPVEEPAPEAPAEPTAPGELPEAETLPAVKHVFLIVLGDNGFEESFGAASPAPYLAKTLRGQGELLSNYYAVAQGELANQIALISGQGPTAETTANCPTYTDVAPATVDVGGQVEGSGCVYPAAAQTLPGQLAAAGMKWKAYVEDIGSGAGQPTTCRHPTLGGPDGSQAPLPGDAYETWRNPFVYFHSLLDGAECAQNDVGLDQLTLDLKAATSTPTLSYIVPNACHDGGELPCEPGQPSGPVAAESFLQTVVPEIEASPAYKEGGLIAITSAQAPQTGPHLDSSACCVTPQYPNLPVGPAPAASTGPVKPTGGGGRVGLLLISPFVKPGSANETGYYNHFSLLLSIEELFGQQPLGYAAELALSGFDSTVYNAETSTSTTPKRATGSSPHRAPGRSRPR